MKTYKGYVRNPAHPEGCIAERYILEESMLYCMEYMPNGSKGSHKRAQYTFMDDGDEVDEMPLDKKGKQYKLGNVEYEQARRWVLRSFDETPVWEE